MASPTKGGGSPSASRLGALVRPRAAPSGRTVEKHPRHRRITSAEYRAQRTASYNALKLYKYGTPNYWQKVKRKAGGVARVEERQQRAPPALDAVQLHEKIQRIVHKPATTPQELDDKVKEYQAVIDDLKVHGWRVLRTLLSEQELPEGAPRTFVPADAGGVLGGDKFLCEGLFIKLLSGNVERDNRCPIKSSYDAYKVARHDFRSSELLQQLNFPNLVVPVQILYRIRGRAGTVQVSVPISERTVAYGSHDAGHTVRSDPESHAYQTALFIAEQINIAPHVVNEHDDMLFTPVDMELHASHVDGREIAVDVSRLLPSTEEGMLDEQQNFYQSPNVFHRLFRPEFTRAYCADRLSSDQFTVFGHHNRDQDLKGARAVRLLHDEVIPRVARELSADSDLSAVLHKAGVNMRYLGEVLLCIVREEEEDRERRAAAMHVLREMVRRTFKEQLYKRFATIPFTRSDKEFSVEGRKLALEAERPGSMAVWLGDKYEGVEVDASLVSQALDQPAMLAEVERQVRGEVWTLGLPTFVRREEAERVLREELRLRAENLGDEKHPQLASTQRALLDLYRKWDRDEPEATAAKAERVIQWLREVAETRLSRSDGAEGVVDALREKVESYFAIARYLAATARFEASEEMWQTCLAALDEADEDEARWWNERATTLNNLAAVHQNQGKYDAALHMYERALKIRTEQLGVDHPNVAMTLNNIANVYDEQGKHDAALEMYGRALKVQEARLGEDHPSVALTLNNIANVLQNQGKYDAALEMYGRALNVQEARLGADHPSVATTLNNMAGVYRCQTRWNDALEMYGRALNISEARLGADHPNVADVVGGMANVYAEQGKFGEALEMYERAMAIHTAAVGENHPIVAQSLVHLALVYERRDDAEDVGGDRRGEARLRALSLLERALRIYRSCLGPRHAHTRGVLALLARLAAMEGDYERAVALNREADASV